MHQAAWIVALVGTVTVASALARKIGVGAPFIMVLVGLVGSVIPAIPGIEITPDLVLIGFLPPLLYAAALETSLMDFRRNGRPIALLSVGLVIATTVAVGLVVQWMLPVPGAVAFAIGAVVSPPDPVAATSIAKRVGMPRRMVTILEGEGLVNDATALVALRTAVAAIGGTVSAVDVALDFVVSSAGGLLVGVLVAYGTGKVRARIHDDITETVVSLLTPFIAYLAAERIHGSGVLAVVSTGLILSHRSHLMQSASSRIFERTNWATIQFLLENTVFLLIGLQASRIIGDAADSKLPDGRIVSTCVAVTLTVILVRPLWIFPATYLARLIPHVAAREPRPPWQYPAAISWAGMRGVVTLAAVFVLPVDTDYREVLILVALVVVGATLLLQGATLPFVLRHLRLQGPDAAEDALTEASVHQRAASAGLKRLDEIATADDRDDVLDRLRRSSAERSQALWERLGSNAETPSQVYTRLRLEMIDAERQEVIRIRDQGLVPDDVLGAVFESIDIEETVLDRRLSRQFEQRQEELTPPTEHEGCEHMIELEETPSPHPPDGCAECLEEGLTWVHLRLCMTCGHVGCCDSSIGRHAERHYDSDQHPVMRSFEPGEAWRWCFIDEVLA